jgi:hypothetical protein
MTDVNFNPAPFCESRTIQNSHQGISKRRRIRFATLPKQVSGSDRKSSSEWTCRCGGKPAAQERRFHHVYLSWRGWQWDDSRPSLEPISRPGAADHPTDRGVPKKYRLPRPPPLARTHCLGGHTAKPTFVILAPSAMGKVPHGGEPDWPYSKIRCEVPKCSSPLVC